MSTYLVAFVVCDYVYISSQTLSRKINVSVYAPKDMIPQADFALKTATDIMDYYEEFFGVEYPLPKQGQCIHTNFKFKICSRVIIKFKKENNFL